MKSQVMPQPVAVPSARPPARLESAQSGELLRTVTREMVRLLSVGFTALSRCDSGTETLVATWTRNGEPGGSDISLRGCVRVPTARSSAVIAALTWMFDGCGCEILTVRWTSC